MRRSIVRTWQRLAQPILAVLERLRPAARPGPARWRASSALTLSLGAALMQLCAPARAEIVLVPRSELFAYMMGQQMGQAISNASALHAYAGNFLAGYAQLNSLRKELSTCGNCARRDTLIKEISALQAYLIDENKPLCQGIDAVKEMPITNAPGIDAVNKITGIGDVCENYKREIEIIEMKVALKQARERFDARLKAGDTGAYFQMGDWIDKSFQQSRVVSAGDRLDLACSYFKTGASKGDIHSLVALPQNCQLNGDEYKAMTRQLVQCTQTRRNEDRCAGQLEQVAMAYSTSRPSRLRYPVQPDEQEALKIWQALEAYWAQRQGASPQDSAVSRRLEIARQQLGVQQQSVQAFPAAGSSGREDIHTHMREWCEGIRERAGRAEILAYECQCFVRETDRHFSEGRLVWAKVKQDGIFDLSLVDACIDREATAASWVDQQRTQMPAGDTTDSYLACAHDAITGGLPVSHFKQRYATGWKGVIQQQCSPTGTRTATAPSPETATRRTLSRPAATSPEPTTRASSRAEEPRIARVDPMQRRCEVYRAALERAQNAHANDPVRHATRYRSALAQYQRACGG